ncbi:hypothetical protein B0O99DRAFT_592946 [Bisporella sp. PMI_857]|nr:hypothetical protein B0O99DRAFT_592946 [Bisporella sp. PMI_857]
MANDDPSHVHTTSLGDYKGEIFQLYIIEKKTLKDVMAIIEETHGITATAAVYKARLEKWGYQKYIKRHEVNAIVKEKQQRELQGKETTFFLRDRPVDLMKIEKYRKRDRVQHMTQPINFGKIQQLHSINHDKVAMELAPLRNQIAGLISTTPPTSPLQRPLASPQVWKIPEKLLYHIDIYIKGSFECGDWYFFNNERLIESSKHAALEQTSIMSFLNGLDMGCRYFTEGKADVGGLYWRKAFREMETLVQGTYHGIIPNLIIKVNDLDDSGHREAAKMLKSYAAQCCLALQSPGHARAAFFRALADAEMDQMKDLEIMVMSCFIHLFEVYVGPRCYSTFVMEMDLARRRLLRGEPIDRCLPVLSDIDAKFGPISHRSLDVIRLRTEFLFHREEYADVETYASLLIKRASTVDGDEWRRLYFLVKGGYHLGVTQYRIENYAAAMETLSACLKWEEEMWKVDESGQFNSEKSEMLKCLENMGSWSGRINEAATWRLQRMQMLEKIVATDILP